MRVRAARNRHGRIGSGRRRERRLRLADTLSIEAARLHTLPLSVEKCVLVTQLQCVLRGCETQRCRRSVWCESEVDLVLPPLVVDSSVSEAHASTRCSRMLGSRSHVEPTIWLHNERTGERSIGLLSKGAALDSNCATNASQSVSCVIAL